MHEKHIFRNTMSFHQSHAIFFRILFHIISFGKHFAMNFKIFPMNDMGLQRHYSHVVRANDQHKDITI